MQDGLFFEQSIDYDANRLFTRPKGAWLTSLRGNKSICTHIKATKEYKSFLVFIYSRESDCAN